MDANEDAYGPHPPPFHVRCQNSNSSVNIFLDLISLLKARVLYVHPVIYKDIIRISDDVIFH